LQLSAGVLRAELVANDDAAGHRNAGTVDKAEFDALYGFMDKGPNRGVVEYLERGGDPNLRGRPHGWTLLHAAAFKGRRQLVELLVAKGADVDALSGHGFTPLADAAHKGHVGCVRVLLAAGASVACRPLGMSLVDSLRCAAVKSAAVRSVLEEAIRGPREGAAVSE
jgi:ankyrin repeat protein